MRKLWKVILLAEGEVAMTDFPSEMALQGIVDAKSRITLCCRELASKNMRAVGC